MQITQHAKSYLNITIFDNTIQTPTLSLSILLGLIWVQTVCEGQQ